MWSFYIHRLVRTGATIIAVIILILFNSDEGLCQLRLNLLVKKKLDSIMLLDQKYRDDLISLADTANKRYLSKKHDVAPGKIEAFLWDKQRKIDALNFKLVSSIVKTYGYPGKSLVGTPTNEVTWYILQHSSRIKQYFHTVQAAAMKNELPFRLYAMMQDRLLMDEGKEQLYGSQLTSVKLKNGTQQLIVWPVQTPKKINERRKKAGFDTTIEEYANHFGTAYRIIYLNDIKN